MSAAVIMDGISKRPLLRDTPISGDGIARIRDGAVYLAPGQLWQRIAEGKRYLAKEPPYRSPKRVSAGIILDRFNFAMSECDGDEIAARGPLLAEVAHIPGWRPFGGKIWKRERVK